MRIIRNSLLITLCLCFLSAQAASDTFTVRHLIGGDITAPSIPANLTATPVATTQIDLSWSSSTDDIAVAGYQVFRDSVQIATTTLITYSDIGLTPSTTYAYYVTAFDTSNNISASSSVVATTTLASTTPPEPPETDDGVRQGTKITGFALRSFEIIPGREFVLLRFETAGFVRPVVKWGKTSSYEIGTIAARAYAKVHEIRITDLQAGTRYYFTLEGENPFEDYGTLTSGTFITLPPVDVFPPGNVSDLHAYADGDDVILEWRNPPDEDFEYVRVLRNEGFYPGDPADGWLIYEGDGVSVRDEGLAVPGTRQFYSVFSYDERGNVSSGAVVAIAFDEDGSAVDVDIIDEDANAINLSFSDLIFMQDGEILAAEEGRVKIDGSKHLTVLLPYGALPEHLKSILVTLREGENSNETFTFMLRINGDKSAYEAQLAPLGTRGIFPLRISVFDFKTSQIGYAAGAILSEIAFSGSDTSDETFFGYLIAYLKNSFGGYVLLFILFLSTLSFIGWRLIAGSRKAAS